MPAVAARPARLPLIAAFAAVYLIWGSTYLAIGVVVHELPPFLTAGLRFLVAGVLLLGWAIVRGAPRPKRHELKGAVVTGVLFFLGGNGGVVWAQQHLPSGLTALLVATVPAWVVVLSTLVPPRRAPTRLALVGVSIGFVGVAVLVLRPAGSSALFAVHAGAVAALVTGAGCWALGTLLSGRIALPASRVLGTGVQVVAGGLALVLAGLATGEGPRLLAADITSGAVLALLYLVVFGSIVAFSAYAWLMTVAEPSQVATYAYVNPVVAVLLGAAFAGEAVGPRILVGGLLIVTAVVLIQRSGRTRARVGAACRDRE